MKSIWLQSPFHKLIILPQSKSLYQCKGRNLLFASYLTHLPLKMSLAMLALLSLFLELVSFQRIPPQGVSSPFLTNILKDFIFIDTWHGFSK